MACLPSRLGNDHLRAPLVELIPKFFGLQGYSSLENSMDCIVHGVAKSWT